ncbi:hypothetical protein SUGI_1197370 [Cryptomeria japonica]|uniref:uncharacterized protein LOC131035812 n=1 Tax=Cryptomeria japonica TaxID=3369 RepID=UPI00241492C9|nr:uncharacterized protein LOC131035812 [Cryptomeria japonica]GLJ55757.1 hypothetical protein SUGI_1197370 [Cryptomeria japonica]
MEGKAEKLGLLGAFGIVTESIRILSCCPRIIVAITLTLVLPLSLEALLHTLISLPLSAKLLFDELNSLTSEDVNERAESHWQLTVFIACETVYGVSVYALSGLLTAAMASTVASIYSGKQEPSLARLIRILLTTWKRMLITSLWVFFLLVLNIVAFALAVSLLIWSFNHFNVTSTGPFNAALILISMVFVWVWVNIIVLWKLACVVCVVEEKSYGLEGMKKSLCLINGKDSTALLLTLLCLVIDCGFSYAVVRGNVDAVDFEGSNAFGAILVMLECGVVLMGPLMQSVLYFVCKSYHRKSIHKLWVVDQLEDYYLV